MTHNSCVFFISCLRNGNSSVVIAGDTCSALRGAERLERGGGSGGGGGGGGGGLGHLPEQGTVGPVCPDLQCSHPTARGQSNPRHTRERRIPNHLQKARRFSDFY
ncbi:uncharacterized protein ACO6RY_18614 [Pungitius sinensis]